MEDLHPCFHPFSVDNLKEITRGLQFIELMAILSFDEIPLRLTGINRIFYDSKNVMIGYKCDEDGNRTPTFAKSIWLCVVKSIHGKWECPLGYLVLDTEAITLEDVVRIVPKCITQCRGANVVPTFLSSDQLTAYREAVSAWNIRCNQAFTHILVSEVYYVYDIYHIMKRVRAALMKKDKNKRFIAIQTSTGDVLGSIVYKVFKNDGDKNLKWCPDLTEIHFVHEQYVETKRKYSLEKGNFFGRCPAGFEL